MDSLDPSALQVVGGLLLLAVLFVIPAVSPSEAPRHGVAAGPRWHG
jgi:hypothetical protein